MRLKFKEDQTAKRTIFRTGNGSKEQAVKKYADYRLVE